MDFSYPEAAEAFRLELRSWLDEHVTEDVRGQGPSLGAEAGSPELERLLAWNRDLADARYAAIAWPEEYGGRGASVMDQVVWAEEMHRAGAPGPINVLGIPNVAPAIMTYGSDAQKRSLLPPMMRGDDIWCQGFSEPDAGSDLASLRTSAVRDGDVGVVNGQKSWTSLGHLADWCELLVRTDAEAPKHQGISCLLVDMTLPGITVRPLITITGGHDFNEMFFDDVRVPVASMLGPENEGWRVAMTTLSHERAGVAKLHLGTRAKVARLLEEAMGTPLGDGRTAAEEPALRQRLARVYLEAELLKLVSDRAISGELHGRTLGPESSIAKLVWSETEQHIAEVAAAVLGPMAGTGSWGTDRVAVRSHTIAGGTTQVNKNIIARRVLGLPR
ncbi:MAG: acyl-CoA dehydrogenase family protein [Acidimicrobiia bacterium]|nr:acyl-CoA dehydrogenase family protein [Acidimicrobiia bacterium]